MKLDSILNFRKSCKDVGRCIKGVFKPRPLPQSSGANLTSTQTLHITTQVAPPSIDPSPHTVPLPTVSAAPQDDSNTSHMPSEQPVPVTNITSHSRANVPPSSKPLPSPTSTFETAKDIGSVAWAGLGTALRVLKESSDAFPPLKSAVSGFLACLDVLQVCAWDSIITGVPNPNIYAGSC
jgi:hypothetical protein